MNISLIRSIVVLLALAMAAPNARAQNPPPGTAGPSAPIYSPQQLDQLLAPIALYPDQLLTQVLIAATYPQQIVDAGQWLQDPNNAKLSGDALVAALQPLDWDPSVKSLIAFPQIIATLNQHMDWTQALGIAFANQQADTMAQIQELRQQAAKAGMLKTTTQLAVTNEGSDIIIAPADPGMVYVPVYNPATVYGDWQYADYPPVYLPPPPSYTGAIGVGIAFGVGVGIVRPLWGFNHPEWRSHQIAVDPRGYAGLSVNHQPPPSRTWQHQGPVVPATLPATRPAAPAFEHPPGTVVPSAVTVPGRGLGGAPATTTTGPAGAPAHPPSATPAVTTPPAHEAPLHQPGGTTPAVTAPPQHEAPQGQPGGTTPAVTTPPAHEAPLHPPGTTPAVTTPPTHEAPVHPPGTTPAVTPPPAHEAPIHPPGGTTPAVTNPPPHEAPVHTPTPAVVTPPPAPPSHPAPPPVAAPAHPAPPPAQHPAPPPGGAPPPKKPPPGQPGEEPPK